ncbi:MAG TPA: DUF3137 domain-containing protein [Symbiobacteriaceae bacterium]|nr:DUF3137 domain-containing protein [Symbiobacteriaceae bacterium]
MKPAGQFQAFYQAELLPHLQELEEKRKQVASRVVTAGIATGAATLVAVLAVLAYAPHPAIALFPFVLGAIVFAFVYSRVTSAYAAQFKDSIIGRIVQYVDPGLRYDRMGFIAESDYLRSSIFLTDPDRYHGEDLVYGMVGKTEVKFSEIHSEYRTEHRDSKGNRRTEWHTIFKGIFFVADFNKHFAGETVVLPDTAETLFGKLGQMFQSWNIARPGDLVRLEDVAFEERFVVYATDQIEARYLLSPSLMARIVDFRARTNREIYLSFVASNIYVAIANQRDLFEPKVFTSVLDMALAQQYLDDLMLAVSIVEELNLNTRIWTKQ